MRNLVALISATAVVATLLPASAFAATKHHARYVREQPVYAAVAPDPLIYPVGGAIIGAIIGAAVCPPCTVAGSALTAGGGALVGAGIGAVGGTVVEVAARPPYPYPAR